MTDEYFMVTMKNVAMYEKLYLSSGGQIFGTCVGERPLYPVLTREYASEHREEMLLMIEWYIKKYPKCDWIPYAKILRERLLSLDEEW